MSVTAVLEGNGIEAYEAENGKEAINLIGQDEFTCDIILLDLTMPEMGGIEFLEQVQPTGLASRVPIIIMTATTDEAEIQRAADLGARDCIHKPFTIDHIEKLKEVIVQ